MPVLLKKKIDFKNKYNKFSLPKLEMFRRKRTIVSYKDTAASPLPLILGTFENILNCAVNSVGSPPIPKPHQY